MNTLSQTPDLIIELAGHISSKDKHAAAYRMLPFEIPRGIVRLEVQYSFSKDEPGGLFREAGNILDIGLFDARGSEFLTAQGFRGWSGSAIREFAVGLHSATPGYLAGPITEGQWEIILGMHRILPDGCDYKVIIELYAGEESTQFAETVLENRIVDPSSGWYRGELHCHTHHSEAPGTLEDLLSTARAQGLDFVAVTEHNTVSHIPELAACSAEDILFIPGMEITTDGGHANVWGIDRWVEFRCDGSEKITQVVRKVNSQGALISINHPKDIGPPWTYGLESSFDCIEVWQLAWFMGNDQSLELWDKLLKEGHCLTAVGGSDYHQEPFSGELGKLTLGTPCNWVFAKDLSVEGVLSGVESGHVFVSENPMGPRVFLEASHEDQRAMIGDEMVVPTGDEITISCLVEGAAGSTLCLRSPQEEKRAGIDTDHFSFEMRVRINEATYFRVEILDSSDPSMLRALTNPIFLSLTNS